MQTPPELENLKLRVANFGPIVGAEIDLRPFTVFVGPSNTGKSYLAILIYALHRFFRMGAFPRHRSSSTYLGGRVVRRGGRRTELPSPAGEHATALKDLLESVFAEQQDKGAPLANYFTLPESIAALVRSQLEDTTDLGTILNYEISRCFGVQGVDSLVRKGSKGGGLVATERGLTKPAVGSGTYRYEFPSKGENTHLEAFLPESMPLRIERHAALDRLDYLTPLFDAFVEGEYSDYLSGEGVNDLIDLSASYLFNPLTQAHFYLPADRTGIMHAHRVVVSSLIGRAPRAGLGRDVPLPALSGVLADFLTVLIGIGDRPRAPIYTTSLAGVLEDKMLGGAIHYLDSITGYPEFSYQPFGWKADIPLMNASSMVSELAPVVLYLRHVVRPGNVLIIEEPESHLHPAMQVELVRLLVAAVHAGIRIMITTHSEWVLDELANLVRLWDLPQSQRGGIAGAEFALDPKQLGVWLFEPKRRPKGSVVSEIPFDGEYGGFRSSFNDVAIDIHNGWAETSNRIEELKSE